MEETDNKKICVTGLQNYLKNQNKPLLENKNILPKIKNEKEPKNRVDSI